MSILPKVKWSRINTASTAKDNLIKRFAHGPCPGKGGEVRGAMTNLGECFIGLRGMDTPGAQ